MVKMSRSHTPIYADDECFSLAKEYSLKFSRRDVFSISDFVPDLDAQSFIICAPHNLNRTQLDVFTKCRFTTVGVATARNTDELQKFLARQNLHRDGGNNALFDEIYGSIYLDNLKNKYPSMIPKSDIAHDFDLLSMHVHGEGAHANLRSIVLCGQAPLACDSYECSSVYCKRSKGSDGLFIPFYDLNASEVLFLSCNGLSVSEEHYPSRCSAVLSLISGKKFRGGVFNDRTVPLDPDEVLMAYNIGRQEGLQSAHRFLNDLSAPRFKGIRPWILIGDPEQMWSNKSIETPRKFVDLQTSHFYIFNKYPAKSFVPTEKVVYFIDEDDTKCDINDVTNDALVCEKNLQSALCIIQFIESLIISMPNINSFPGFLQEQIMELKRVILSLLSTFNMWRRNLILKRSGQRFLDTASKLFELAPITISKVVKLLVSEDLENFLINSLDSSESIFSKSVCQRCKSNTDIINTKVVFAPLVNISVETCPTCGLCSVDVGNICTSFNISPLTRNSTISISANKIEENAWSFLSLRDKSVGEDVITSECIMSDSIPGNWKSKKDLHYDLHTARIVTATSLGIRIERHRIAQIKGE